MKWISVKDEDIPIKGLVDLWAFGQRYTECYYDNICDEWRKITETNHLVNIKRRAITHWMYLPDAPKDE